MEMPRIEGFWTGQRVQIADTADPDYGMIGWIIAIYNADECHIFEVDISIAKRSERPIIRKLASTQLQPG